MALSARNRVEAVNFLHVDYEEVSISYYVEGARNDLGEPSRTLTVRNSAVKCSLNPMVGRPTFPTQAGDYPTVPQGILSESTHTIFVEEATTLNKGDVITDYDGNQYDVLHSRNLYTHKEGYLKIKT